MRDSSEIEWPSHEAFQAALDDETLPDDTLLELGRLTYATIKLEACCEEVLDLVEWSAQAAKSGGWRPTSQRIKDAVAILQTWPAKWSQDAAIEWLSGVREALDRRHAVLHGSPSTWVPLPGTEPIPIPPTLSFVSKANDHVITELEPTELRSITRAIRDRRAGWRTVYASIEDALVDMRDNGAGIPRDTSPE